MTSFRSSWPPWRQEKAPQPSLSEQLTQAMLKGKRILFLDDDEDLCELVQRIADKYEMQLVKASTSGQARTILESGAEFDAAILDINVVNGNGIALYRWLRGMFPRLQVIFLTGLEIESAAEKVHAVGAAPVYAKPTLWNSGFMEDLFEKLGCRRKAVG